MSGTNTTSVPSPSLTPAGYVVPSEDLIFAGALADIDAALGGGTNPAVETPQGQIASSRAAIIADKNDQFVKLSQSFDPAYADGRWQDGLARIYFLERNPARPTVHDGVVCTGRVNTPIPTGALVKAADGNFYACTAGGRIGNSGTIVLPFACLTTGPIPLPADTLELYQIIPGWDTVSNPTDGVLGAVVESRAAFEKRRQQSVFKNSKGSLYAVQSEVLAVPGVLDAYTFENVKSATISIDGVTVTAKSLYVCVAGGDPQTIADAIWRKKSPGCGYSGDTTMTVVDDQSGYQQPYPTYEVSYQTAQPDTFVVLVSLSASVTVPSNAQSLVAAAVLAAFSGADGGPRARIGARVLASRYYAGVAALGSWAQIVEIQLGSSIAGAAAGLLGSISSGVLTVSSMQFGTLAAGQTLIGAGIPDGVRLVAKTGPTTWSVSDGSVTAYAQMRAAMPNLSAITVGAAHVPVLSAANVQVALI